MDFLDEIIKNLYKHLTDTEGSKTNIIRKHTKNLEDNRDLSFPLNISNWRQLVKTTNCGTIFQYLNNTETSLITSCNSCLMKLLSCDVIKDNVYLRFDRTKCYETAIKTVLEMESYGCCGLPINKFYLRVDIKDNNDVSELRVKIIKTVAENLIRFCNGTISEDPADVLNLRFSLCSNEKNVCSCGVVLNGNGVKDKVTTEEEYINKHMIHMRLMAEHKYGLRVTSRDGWQEFFRKLGEASVILELLQNKCGNNLRLNISDPTVSNHKGSSFILYNCARLSKLFKEFDSRVDSKAYPPLPLIENVDFSLLKEPEEWELFYVYVLQFPSCINQCLRDVTDFKVYPHYLVQHLSGFCAVFSIYYRREPREHLFPALFAKIYLLKTLERVMHTGLRLLNIEPIRQM